MAHVLDLPSVLSEAHRRNQSTLSLRVRFKYEADLAGGHLHEYASEIDPDIHVFATHELGVLDFDKADDGVVVVSTKNIDGNEITVEVPFNPAAAQFGKLSDDRLWALPGARSVRAYAVPDEEFRWELPTDASLAFNVYVETATEHGQLCRTRAGESLFLLQELFQSKSEHNVRAEWQVTGDTPLVKGFVDVQSVELVRRSSAEHYTTLATAKHVHFAPLVPEHVVFHGDDHREDAGELVSGTTQRLNVALNDSMRAFFPQGSAPLGVSDPPYVYRMHCPYYNTTVGVVPGSGYSLRVPRAPPPPHFYEKVFAAMMLRNDANADDVMLAVHAQRAEPTRTLASSRYVSKLFVEMLTVYANAMVYLNDFTNETGRTLLAELDSAASPDASKRSHVSRVHLVHRNQAVHVRPNIIEISEDYKIARSMHADDCEGVALEIYLQYWQFRRATLSKGAHPLLVHMQHIGRSNLYTPELVLAAVTNKKLDPGVRALSDAEAMAHTYTAFQKTSTFIARLVDASSTDAQFAGMAAVVRESAYARAYTAEPWHEHLDDVLVAEGTARSNAFTMPTVTYYDSDARKKEAERQAVKRINAQISLMQSLPMSAISVEVPNRHIADPNNDIVENRVDASDFYKGNSTAYISAFRDTGILDFAFASQSTETESHLTHGAYFNRFAARKWDDQMRVVPYFRMDKKVCATVDAALAQLEPIPALRRDVASARTAERAGAPTLAPIEALFSGGDDAAASRCTAILRTNAELIPLPPSSIVLTVRNEDLTDAIAKGIVDSVRTNRAHFSSAKIHTHYLSDPPNEHSELPPVILHDIELRLR